MATQRMNAVLVLSAMDRMSSVINSAVTNAQRRLQNFSRSAMSFGRSAVMGAAVIATPLVGATKAAIDFEESLGNVETLLGGNVGEFKRLSAGVQGMRGLAVPLSDLTSGLYDVVSAGVDADKRLSTLDKSARLAVAGLSDTKSAVDLMTSGMNAFRSEGLSANTTANIFFKTVKAGKTTVAELAPGFGAMASVAQNAKVKLADLQAATAALTATGVPTSQAQTMISASIGSMIKPSSEMSKIMRSLGVQTGEELVAKYGTLGNAMAAVKSQAGKLNLNLAKVLGRKEALGAVTLLTGEANRAYTETLADMTSGSDALGDAYKRQSQKGAKQLQILKNNLQSLAITIGNALLPVVSSLVGVFQNVANWVQSMSEKYPNLTRVVTVAAGAVAGLLAVLGTFGIIAGAVASGGSALLSVYSFLTTRVKLLTAAKWLLNAAETALLVIGQGLVIGYFTIASAIDALRSKTILATIATKAAAAAQWLVNAAMAANPIGIIIAAVAALGAAVAWLVSKWHNLLGWFQKASPVIKVLAGVLLLPLAPIFAVVAAIRFLIDNWNGMLAALGGTWGRVVGFFQNIYNGISGIFSSIVEFVRSVPERMYEAGRNIVNSLWEGIKSLAMAPVNLFKKIVGGIRNLLPFSPAKTGPLRDIHRIKLVETVAQSIKPAPMVRAMENVATKTRAAISPAGAPGLGASPSIANAVPVPRGGAGGGTVVNVSFAPQISGVGAGRQEAESLINQIQPLMPQLVRMIDDQIERRNRAKF